MPCTREPRGAPLPQRLRLRIGGRRELDDGGDLVAEAFARAADHERVHHVVVALEDRLHLLDEHLLAPGVHDEGVAPEQHDLPVGREPGAVTGNRDPHAVDDRERRLRRRFVVEVPERDVVAARQPPDFVVVGVEEAGAIGGQESSPGAEREALALGRARRPRRPTPSPRSRTRRSRRGC